MALTPQQIEAVKSEAKSRGFNDAQTQRLLEVTDGQFSGIPILQPKPTTQPTPNKQGINIGGALKSIVKDPVKTLLVKPAVRAAQAGIAAYGAVSGNQKALDYSTQDQNVKLPLLGNFNIEGQKSGLAGVKQVAGDAAKSASYLYTPGKVAGTLGKEVTAGTKILQGAKAGAIGGGLFSGGEAAIQNKSIGGIAKDTATGAATGAVIGGAIPAAIEGVKALQKTSVLDLPRIEKPSLFQNNTIQKRTNELNKLDTSPKIRKALESAKAKGFDVKKMATETDLLVGSVDQTGKFKTIGDDGAVQKVRDFIEPQEPVISQTLKKEGITVPLDLVKKEGIDNINKSGLKGAAKLNAIKRLEDDISGYATEVDKNGNISLSVLQDAKIDKYRNLDFTNPEKQRADKSIASALKKIIEDNTKSLDVKAANNDLAKYYSLIEYLSALDGKTVEGGKLGKYFAQTIGGIAGSHFGPIGTMAGAEIAGKIKGYQMASKFGAKVGNDLKVSPLMEKAINNLKKP